ncbi:MAG: hypothetical protein FPO08_05800 [Geobacter sp.]|nr:MAG: hypothetical protein FPO08_05800 [Geobacter sp.]
MSEGMVSISAERLKKLEERERKDKLAARMSAVKLQLYAKKAKEQNIIVTKEEILNHMAAEDAKKASGGTQA